MDELYVKLRERLDELKAGGFPEVPGVDIPYLKKTFYKEDFVHVFLAMEDKLQTCDSVAERLGWDVEKVRDLLEEMSKKGLAFTTTRYADRFYMPMAWLLGWGDWTAYYEDKELADLEGEYKFGYTMAQAEGRGKFVGNVTGFRTVPIYDTIPDKTTVADYDNIRAIMRNADSISVAKCYCECHRQVRGDKPIYEPIERCFLFDTGYGRKVSADEAIEILEKCKDAGLVQNVTDIRNPVFLCNCADHCGANITRRFDGSPRASNYRAKYDASACIGCGACEEKCWLGAIEMEDGAIQFNREKCIGCGVCTTKCEFDAIHLKRDHPECSTMMKAEDKLKWLPPMAIKRLGETISGKAKKNNKKE